MPTYAEQWIGGISKPETPKVFFIFSSLDPAVHLLDSDYDDPEPDYVRRPDETVCAIGEHYHYQ